MSRRRVECPSCRTQLVVPPAAEERGRMRCPECEEVIDLRGGIDSRALEPHGLGSPVTTRQQR